MDTSTPAVRLQLPVTLSYAALEAAARKKMLGQALPPSNAEGEEPYARLLDLRMAPSPSPGYDLLLKLKMDLLRTFFKREGVELYVLVELGYDNQRQLLYVRKYKVDARTQSRIYNGSLEMLANSVGYEQILKRARFRVGDVIAREMGKVNDKLASGMALKGLQLQGGVESVQVVDIAALPEGIYLKVLVEAQLQLSVQDLLGLMPEEIV